jgi:hypothetical protein
MNSDQRNRVDTAAGVLFIIAFLLIVANGIYLAYRDRMQVPPTNYQCSLILHEGISVPPFTAEDCKP